MLWADEKPMQGGIMLLGFGARNFFSFKEGIKVSLELGGGCPDNFSHGRAVANILCVKGANGSGKTNVLKILSFLNHFCCNSFSSKPEDVILVSSFFHNEEPIELFCEFVSGSAKYLYEVSLTARKVLQEKLFRKIERTTLVVERDDTGLTTCIKKYGDLKKIKIRKNASIISIAHQYEISSLEPIYGFFHSIVSNVSWAGRIDYSKEFKLASQFYVEHPAIFKQAKEFIRKSDLGIKDVKIKSATDDEGKQFFYPIFRHGVKDVEHPWLPYHAQSLGTKTMYNTIYHYLLALDAGGILVTDEFDIDFHPNLLPKFVGYFDDDVSNRKNAQMIFSTHNNEILNYMGKYRTMVVNKEDGESYGYRLDQIPGDIIRNDRPLVPLYISGRIGGVPRL